MNDDQRGFDPQRSAPLEQDDVEFWEDSDLLGGFAEELRAAYILPIDVATRARHLAAIARAASPDPLDRRTRAATRRLVSERGWSAPGSHGAAGAVRGSTGTPARLASPFSRPAPAPRTAPQATTPKLAGVAPAAGPASSRWTSFGGSMLSKAAATAAVFAIAVSGLAFTGALPNRVQTVFFEASELIGLNLPAPEPMAERDAPAPVREQTVPVLQASPAPPVPSQAAAPVAVPPPAAPPAHAPAVDSGSAARASEVVKPGSQQPDLESWLAELIRQALAASSSAGRQAHPSGGTGPQQRSSDNGAWSEEWKQDRPDSRETPRSSGSGSRSYRQP